MRKAKLFNALLCTILLATGVVVATEVNKESTVVNATSEKTVSLSINDYVANNSITVSSGTTINTVCKSITIDDVATVSFAATGTSNSGSFWGSTTKDWRLYEVGGITLNVTTSGKNYLKSVKFTYTTSNSGTLKLDGTAKSSGTEIANPDKDDNDIVLTVGNTSTKTNGQVRITSISVKYEVDALELSAPTGSFVERVVSWNNVDNSSSYTLGLFGSADSTTPLKEFTNVTSPYDLSTFTPQGDYYIKVKAIGDGSSYLSSSYSSSIGSFTNSGIDTKTILEASNLACEDANDPHTYFQITGKVSNVVTNDSRDSFSLIDNLGNSIYIFRISKSKALHNSKSYTSLSLLDVYEGDTLTIIGYKTIYNSTQEFIGYYISSESNPGNAFKTLDLKSSLKLNYTLSPGTPEESKTAIMVSSVPATDKNMRKNTDESSRVFTGEYASDFEVYGISTASTFTGLYDTIRQYTSSSTNIRCKVGLITNIVVTYSNDKVCPIYINTGELTPSIDGSTYTYNNVNSNYFVVGSPSDTSKISSIEIKYVPKTYTASFTSDGENVNQRFAINFTKSVYDNIIAKDSEAVFGIALNKNATFDENSCMKIPCNPVRVDASGKANGSGNFYQYSVLLQNIPSTYWTQTTGAAAYVTIDGVTYYSNYKNLSVKSLANDYITNYAYLSSVMYNYDGLKYLADYVQPQD